MKNIKNIKIQFATRESIVMQTAERILTKLNLVKQGCWRDFRMVEGVDVTVLSNKEQNEDIKAFFDLQAEISPLIRSRHDVDAFFVYSYVREYRKCVEQKCFEEILAECSELREFFSKLKNSHQKLLREMDKDKPSNMQCYSTVYEMFSESVEKLYMENIDKKVG